MAKTITFTNDELNVLIGAAEMWDDMRNDMSLDDIDAINMFPRDSSQEEVLTMEKAKRLRDQIDTLIKETIVRDRLLQKLKS